LLEILHGLAAQIPIRTIYRKVTPFTIADLVLLALLTLFPAISIWLPTLTSRRT
jgi:C4-dicarboxylate transporter, DctM subunit